MVYMYKMVCFFRSSSRPDFVIGLSHVLIASNNENYENDDFNIEVSYLFLMFLTKKGH